MCFMKPPKIPDNPPPAPPPTPLADTPTGVDVAGTDKDKKEKSGRKSLRVERTIKKRINNIGANI